MPDDALAWYAAARKLATIEVFEMALNWKEEVHASEYAVVYERRYRQNGVVPEFAIQYIESQTKVLSERQP